MTENYYLQDTKDVEHLAHFPYKNFADFKEARKNGEIMDFGIAMDHAREWVTQAREAPAGWRNLSNFLMFIPYLLVIFYIIFAFVVKNYWLIPYSVLPVLFTFFANPIGRKVFKIHYYFIGIYIVVSFFLPNLWSPIYWFPLLLVYLSLNQLYGGSAQIVRDNLTKNEHLLCIFWKWWDLVIYKKDGRQYTQRDFRFNELFENYEDIDKEWKEYVDLKYKKDEK